MSLGHGMTASVAFRLPAPDEDELADEEEEDETEDEDEEGPPAELDNGSATLRQY